MVLDIILVVLLVASVIGGWRSGAMTMLLSVVILFAAAILASVFAMKVGGLLHLGPNWSWPIVGFIFTFLVLMIAGSWIKRFIRPKRGLLRGLDGIAGGFLGLIRGVVVIGLLLALFQLVHLPPEAIAVRSVLYMLLIKIATVLIAVLKPYIHAPGSSETTIV
jgi:uncharacterized membrane protein required for colicin V production